MCRGRLAKLSTGCIALFVGASLLYCDGAFAESASVVPRHRITYNFLLAGRYNSLGILAEPDLRYRFRLFDSGNPLKKDAHIGLSFAPSVAASYSRLGPILVIKPLALITFKVGYLFNVWYGRLGSLQSFPYAESDYFSADWDFDAGNVDEYATTGHELMLSLQLLFALGPFVVSNQTETSLSRHDLRPGDRLFYSPRYDVLISNGGWVLTNDTDLVFVSDFGLIGGIRATVIHSFLHDDDFQTGKRQKSNVTPIVTLGPLASFVFFDRPESRLNRPAITLLLGWWLRHQYRTGTEVNRGVPSVMLGFSFEGEIWSRE